MSSLVYAMMTCLTICTLGRPCCTVAILYVRESMLMHAIPGYVAMSPCSIYPIQSLYLCRRITLLYMYCSYALGHQSMYKEAMP